MALIFCKNCGEKSLWYNTRSGKYECLNHKCKKEWTVKELASASYADYQRPSVKTQQMPKSKPQKPQRSSGFKEFGIPVLAVKILESRVFWTIVGVAGFLLWLISGVIIFRQDSALSRAIGIALPILGLALLRFLLKRFVREYSIIAASYTRNKPKNSWDAVLRNVSRSIWLRLFVILLVIAGLVAIPWTGYLLFAHQTDLIIGTVVLLAELVFFVWLIRILSKSKNMSRKPSFKLVFFSLLGIALVFAFAGIEPLATYKDISLDYVKEQGQKAVGLIGNAVTSLSKATQIAPEGEVESPANIVKLVKPAVVFLYTEISGVGYGGSGMIIDKAGYILTNSHVLHDLRSPTVVLSTG